MVSAPPDHATPPPLMNSYDQDLLRFTCHFCGIELEVPVELGGETAPCPSCGLMITAPMSYGAELEAVRDETPALWEAETAQRDEALQDEQGLAEPAPMPAVVGFGQIIARHPAVRPESQQAAVTEERARQKQRRNGYFPLSVALLSVAILGLSGVLVWRSELWRPSRGGSGSVAGKPSERIRDRDAEEIPAARERAENEIRGLEQAAAPVWPVASDLSKERNAGDTLAEKPVVPAPAVVAALVEEVATSENGADAEPGDAAMVGQVADLGTPVKAPEPGAEEGPEDGKTPEIQPALAGLAESPAPAETVKVAGAEAAGVMPVAGRMPDESLPEVVNLEEPADSSQPATALDRAKETICRFLEAERWQERVPFIFEGESKQAAVRDYFQKHPDRAVTDYRLDFFHSEKGQEGALSMYVYFLTLEQEADGFPVIVKSDAEGKRFGVDWDLHVEFRDRHFAEFVKKKEEESREFRVVIQRVTYWEEDRDQIPGVEDLVCYKIDPPYPGYTQHAFVEKGSEEGKRMMESLSWETDPLAAKVRMQWTKFANGRSYLRVTDLVSRSWAD